jgi:protein phosphatase
VSLDFKVVGKTDVGLVRPGNEDCLHLDEANKVFAVCDGMGGHQAGEVASQTASETIRAAFDDLGRDLLAEPDLDLGRTLPPSGDLLLKSIRLANRAIFNKAAENPGLSGMGTTVVALALEADIMSIAHVGDSRAYRLRDRDLEPLTRDHSWVAEIQQSQNLSPEEASSVVGKNVITRALGVRETVEADYRIIKIKPGEKFILCSDGLCGFADDDEIFDVASRYRDDLNRLVDALIQMANDRGGSDNVTVIALEIVEIKESPLPEIDVFTQPAESLAALEGEDRWLARMTELQNRRQTAEPDQGRGTNKYIIIGIFLVFVVVAVLFVWFLPDQ